MSMFIEVPVVKDTSDDDFFMYLFKVKKCTKTRTHDWTECPFSHKGEKARRRDPRKYHYAAVICPHYREGSCGKGDLCEYAHGVFEYWLHPSRYKTRYCNSGICCPRRVCFFAHSVQEIRPFTKYKCRCHPRARKAMAVQATVAQPLPVQMPMMPIMQMPMMPNVAVPNVAVPASLLVPDEANNLTFFSNLPTATYNDNQMVVNWMEILEGLKHVEMEVAEYNLPMEFPDLSMEYYNLPMEFPDLSMEYYNHPMEFPDDVTEYYNLPKEFPEVDWVNELVG